MSNTHNKVWSRITQYREHVTYQEWILENVEDLDVFAHAKRNGEGLEKVASQDQCRLYKRM